MVLTLSLHRTAHIVKTIKLLVPSTPQPHLCLVFLRVAAFVWWKREKRTPMDIGRLVSVVFLSPAHNFSHRDVAITDYSPTTSAFGTPVESFFGSNDDHALAPAKRVAGRFLGASIWRSSHMQNTSASDRKCISLSHASDFVCSSRSSSRSSCEERKDDANLCRRAFPSRYFCGQHLVSDDWQRDHSVCGQSGSSHSNACGCTSSSSSSSANINLEPKSGPDFCRSDVGKCAF